MTFDVFLIEGSTNPTDVSAGEEISADAPAAVVSMLAGAMPALTARVQVTEDRAVFRWDVLEPILVEHEFRWDVVEESLVEAVMSWAAPNACFVCRAAVPARTWSCPGCEEEMLVLLVAAGLFDETPAKKRKVAEIRQVPAVLSVAAQRRQLLADRRQKVRALARARAAR